MAATTDEGSSPDEMIVLLLFCFRSWVDRECLIHWEGEQVTNNIKCAWWQRSWPEDRKKDEDEIEKDSGVETCMNADRCN